MYSKTGNLEGCSLEGSQIIMDKAYEGNQTKQLVVDLDIEPMVPPKNHRLAP